MDNKTLISKIFSEIKKTPNDVIPYNDLFTICRSIEGEGFKMAHDSNMDLRNLISRALKNCNASDAEKFFELYRKSLLFDAPHYLDSYMLYLEINRKPNERFYQPRRKVLKQTVDALQELVDDELDELFLSQPPRTGKTALLMFLLTWLIGKNSEVSNLYSAYSDTITKAMHNGVLEVLQDPVTYLWKDVFPNAKIVQTNSQDETINIDRKKRYPSLTCRSLYGTLNGACDCNGFEIADDLIGGIEEALNKDRLVAAWSKVDNNLLPRAKEKAKILWCGTRWSLIDPVGLRMELLENDEKFKNRRYKIINLSALDENDESQFDYDYGVGFSTEYYQQRRASFERNNDTASWQAQYQGEPIEREGALFAPNDMRYYNGELPTGEADRIFMAVDPAFGGGDYVASPICVQYGDDIYVPDVVFDNHDKKVTQPLIADKVIRHSVHTMRIEANKSTEAYKEGVEEQLKKRNTKINITTKAAPSNASKAQRIFDKAPDIRERMIFLESGKRSKEYELFMQNVFSYKIVGKNKHDDAPDCLSMAIDMVHNPFRKAEAIKRPF